MAFHEIKNVALRGISACVPEKSEAVLPLEIFNSREDAQKFIDTTGVASRYMVKDSGICTSDLCFEAAETLMNDLNWNPEEIDCLIFVSQTPDYILPATACVLHERLGLSRECFAMDISLGCSGWVYGLSSIASYLSGGSMKKGLLLVGDTATVTKSPKDKSTYPLFGDAGTAAALEYDENAKPMRFNFGTDGKGHKAIMIPDGGFRNFFNVESFHEEEIEPGIIRSKLHSILDGPGVFAFGLSRAPKSVKAVTDHFGIDREGIDHYIFHQANLLMNEKIRAKLKIEEEKVSYSLKDYGNTSSASIPLTMVTQLRNELRGDSKKYLACAFGVGLSWASVVFEGSGIKCPEVIKLKSKIETAPKN